MTLRRIRFFLDYGTCFWAVDGRDHQMPEDLLSPEVLRELNTFLREYDQHYNWGCPPSYGWQVEDCRRFNREYKRILNLVARELWGRFMVGNEQMDLIEDSLLLAEFYRRGRAFVEEQMVQV